MTTNDAATAAARTLDPDRLDWGVATAAYQVEGATDRDGRGPSIWDTFAARPGATRDGQDGSTACGSYDRLDEDLALVRGLGVQWYRFSIAWPRVVPEGTGAVEPRGLDYYDRLVDGLLAQGTSPMPTLYHWDLPQPLEDRGGWTERTTAEAFADYAAVVHERIGDRVQHWATLNEPWCAAYLGYAAGVHAPGRREGGAAHVAAHHLNLAHALGAARLRALGARSVGVVHNLAPVRPERAQAEEMADRVDATRNRVWIDPLVDGAYDERLLAVAPELADETVVRDGDLAAMHGSADWLGVNYYTPLRVDVAEDADPGKGEASAYPGATGLVLPEPDPVTDIGWEVDATGLEELLLDVHRRTSLPLVVTENGAAYHDAPAPDGSVPDPRRVAYLRDHVAAARRAREAGADLRAYVLWTLLDNFEWAEGYTQTFGIVHVDRTSLDRTPKDSYHWYARVVAGAEG